jgi:hypothetical protein
MALHDGNACGRGSHDKSHGERGRKSGDGQIHYVVTTYFCRNGTSSARTASIPSKGSAFII